MTYLHTSPACDKTFRNAPLKLAGLTEFPLSIRKLGGEAFPSLQTSESSSDTNTEDIAQQFFQPCEIPGAFHRLPQLTE